MTDKSKEKAACFMCADKVHRTMMVWKKIGGKLRSICPRCDGTICRPLDIVDSSLRR